MLQRNEAMERHMSAHHNHTASRWLDHAGSPDWTNGLGDMVRAAFEAIDAGGAASHDYRKLAVRGLAPQEVGKAVFQKHFSK